mgnify:CR=1 FL=1
MQTHLPTLASVFLINRNMRCIEIYYTMTEKDAEYSYLALFAVTAGSVVSIELSGASGPSFVCNKPGGSYSFAIIKDPILNGKVNFRHVGTGDGHVFKLMIK